MITADVWVVYNKYTKEIVWVTAEHFLADRKWDELVDDSVVDVGLVKNKNKLVVCTLHRALTEIKKEHEAEKEYLKSEYEQASRWATT